LQYVIERLTICSLSSLVSSKLIFSIPDGTARIYTPRHNQSAAIVASLRKLRREIWREMGLLDFWSSYTSSQLLSEEHIMTLAKNAAGESGILAGAPLLTALKIGESRGHILNDFAPPILSAMWAAWLSVPASPPKPPGAPLRERV
jgi:hypothetical protein